jgi:UDP-sulfoquinovose synthase
VRILVLGGDGYLGWPTALHLSHAGHTVAVADNFARRGYDEELAIGSLVPVASLADRIELWADLSGQRLEMFVGDLTDAEFTHRVVEESVPRRSCTSPSSARRPVQ